MRKTIGKLTTVFAICAMLLLCGAIVFAMPNATVASARNSVIFNEDFDSVETSGKWLKNDFGELKENVSLNLYGGAWQRAITYTGYQVHGDCEIKLTTSAINRGGEDWFAVRFGHTTTYERGPLASAMIAGFANQSGWDTRLIDNYDGQSAEMSDQTIKNRKIYDTSFVGNMVKGKTEIALKLTKQNIRELDGKQLYKLECTHWLSSEERPSEPQYVYEGIAADGYFSFGATGKYTYSIYDIQVTEEDKVVAHEDFTDKSKAKVAYTTYQGESYKGAAFMACGADHTTVWIAPLQWNGAIDTSKKANGIALMQSAIVPDAQSHKQFTLTFDLALKNLPNSSSFGVGLGMTDKAQSANDGFYAALTRDADGNAYIALSHAGRTLAKSDTFTPAESGVFTVSGYHGNKINVQYGDFSCDFTGVPFTGYVALCTNGENAPEAKVDNVHLIRHAVSERSDSESAAIDFSGVKTETDEGETWSSPYIDKDIWYCGSTVVMPNRIPTGKKYISFNRGSDTACFGNYKFYGDFIARFSVTATQNRDAAPDGGMIGLSFGKQMYLNGASECKGVYLCKSDLGMTIRAQNCTFTDGSSVKMQDDDKGYDLWSSNDWQNAPATYNIMVVARGGKVTLYFAPEGADAAEMTVPRAEIDAGDTYGAVAVSGLGDVSFRLHSYAITNISPRSATADENAYETSGSVSKDNGFTLGANASVATKETYKNAIAYFKVSAPDDGTFTVKFGDNHNVTFSSAGITSDLESDGGEREFAFEDLKDNGVVMLYVFGNRVEVGVIGKDDYDDALIQSVAAFTLPSASAGKITFAAGEKEISLKAMNVHDLSATVVAPNGDYSEDTQKLPVKPGANQSAQVTEEKGNDDSGCGSSVAASTSMIFGSVILSTAALLLIRRKKYEK